MEKRSFRDWALENRLVVDRSKYKGSVPFKEYVVVVNHWCHRVLLTIAQLSLIVMLCTVFVNVVLRFCFNSGIKWAEEVPGLLVTLFTFIACAIGVRDHLHISVSMIYDRFKKGGKVRKAMDVLTDVATLLCGIVFFIGGIQVISRLMKHPGILPMTGWPTWIQFIPLVFGGFIVIFDSLLFLFGVLDRDDLLYSEKEIDYVELLEEQRKEEEVGR